MCDSVASPYSSEPSINSPTEVSLSGFTPTSSEKSKRIPTTQWTCCQTHGRSRHHRNLKHSANLFHDKAVTKVAVVLSRLPVTGGEDEKDMRRLVNVCGGCGTREQSIETRFGGSREGDKLVNSRIVGVEAWRDLAAAMDCKVSPQRITSAPAWGGMCVPPAREASERGTPRARPDVIAARPCRLTDWRRSDTSAYGGSLAMS